MILEEKKEYERVLTIAGSDSGGGAGIQADLKTIMACDCFGTSAITAITAQNTLGVNDIHPVPIENVKKQIEAVLDDIGTDAVKTGMLYSSDLMRTVKTTLAKYSVKHIVVDPVMVATSGDRLLLDDAVAYLKNEFIPMAYVITPNLSEAEILLERPIKAFSEFPQAAREIAEKYKTSVFIKGGHFEEDIILDIIYDWEKDTMTELTAHRVLTKNTHGTGCTLSAALACFLARGNSLMQAAYSAKGYLLRSLKNGSRYTIGKGKGAVKHRV